MRKLLPLLLLLSASALAQNARFDGISFSRSGQPAPGSLIAVCTQPATILITVRGIVTGCTPLAPICTSITDLVCSRPNPIVADGLGNYSGYVSTSAGLYTLEFFGSAISPKTLPDQGFGIGGGGGGTTAITTLMPLENCTPDQTGNSFYTVASLTNWFAGHWEFVTNQASFITCMVRIPHPLAVTPNASIVLELAANDGTAGHTASFQSCDIAITATASLNVGAPTCAANQLYTTTATAYSRVTLTYAVQSTVTADNLLVVKIATSTSGTQPTNNIFLYPYLKIDQLL